MDARWVEKNAEVHCGYNNHVKCNARTKLIENCSVTDASVRDSRPLIELPSKNGGRLHADSAYRSAKTVDELKERGIGLGNLVYNFFRCVQLGGTMV